MKKIFLFVALLLSQVTTIQASFDVEARIAYFLTIDRHIRSAYGHHGWPEYEVEANMPLTTIANFCGCGCDDGWSTWANFSIYHKKGRGERPLLQSTEPALVSDSDSSDSGCHRHHRSEITNWTLNFGLKRYLGACCFPASFRPYLGFGIGYANAHFKGLFDRRGNSNHSGFALLAKSGIEYDVTCNIYLNAFADYASNWFSSSRKDCHRTPRFNTGGLKLGIGVGYHF